MENNTEKIENIEINDTSNINEANNTNETSDINETNNINETSGKTRKSYTGRWITAILVLLGLMLILGAVSYVWVHRLNNKNDAAGIGLKNANLKIDTLDYKVTDLVIQLDTTRQRLQKEIILNEALKKENDTLRSMYPIQIRKLEIANVDSTGNAINDYGKEIIAANSMYLMPRITYYSFKPGEKVELFIKLYNSDGDCVTGDDSPEGYSYSYVINSLSPGENLLPLSGWGGPDYGHFTSGTYRFEIWYNEMCLKAKTFKII